jgi:CheY-like chemotaxis protein/anti-sigma regulatory factor (Ser/Thr protein kinase)
MATVLVVDDSPMDRHLIGNLLQKSRLEIAFATDGHEALQVMHNAAPDLVVTDLVMPNMDGLELVAAMVTTYPLVPSILITGKGNGRIAVDALNAGASSYVPKSMLQELLLDSVEDLLSVALADQGQVRVMDYPVECRYSIDNDATKIPALINDLRRFIRRANMCDEAGGIRACVALEEALNNALYHGNLELDSQLRDGDREVFRALIEERRTAYPYRNRKIHVAVTVHADHAAIVIRDEGSGFDAMNLPDPTEPANLEKLGGRGLLLMRTFMDEVRYNGVGNEVTLIKRKQPTNPAHDSEVCECPNQNTLPSSTRMTS